MDGRDEGRGVLISRPTLLYARPKWKVNIPKGGDFCIFYVNDINLWQRFWMRFIGWHVERAE